MSLLHDLLLHVATGAYKTGVRNLTWGPFLADASKNAMLALNLEPRP